MRPTLLLPVAAVALAILAGSSAHAFDSCPDAAVVRIVSIRGVEARALRMQGQVVPLMMPSIAWGTGLLITDDGVILTAKHVIDGAQAIAVFVPGRSEPTAAQLIHVQQSDDARDDFAFIKIDLKVDAQTQLIPLPATPGEVNAGEPIEARGHPGGEKAETRAGGVKLPLNDEGALELDVDLEPGFSGGPICRESGLVGIGVQSDGCGLGVAVPVQRIVDVFREQVRARGLVDEAAAQMRGERWRTRELFSHIVALYAVELAGWSMILYGGLPDELERIQAIAVALDQTADLPEAQLIFAMIYWNWSMLGPQARGCAVDDMSCWQPDEREMLKGALQLLGGAISSNPELLDTGGDLLKAILRACDETTTYCSGR